MCFNHPELVHKHPTHLAISVLVSTSGFSSFSTVPTHLASSVMVWLANLHEPHHHRDQGVSGTRSGLLKHSEPQRTYTKHTSTELARCVGFSGVSASY